MYGNKETNGVFLMPRCAIEHLNGAKKTELKVLVYLFANIDNFSVEKASETLGESADSIMSALSYWRGTGIITEKETNNYTCVKDEQNNIAVESTKASDKASLSRGERGYSTSEIAHARKNDSDFSYLVDYVEKVTGELMNSSKQGDLLYLYDNLGMQCDVIMGITAHCVSEDKRKIRYIVKTAEGIHNDGVRTSKELESYINAKNKYKEFSTFVKKLIGAGDRAFTASEEKTVKKWESELCVSRELVEYAYERTVSLISKPSLPYMSKIIEGWHNEGINTVEQAKQQSEGKAKIHNENSVHNKAKKSGLDINLDDIFEKP